MRWDDYVLEGGSSFSSFWSEYLGNGNRDLLFVVGAGFDPRMPLGIEAIVSCGGKGTRDCLILGFDEGSESASRIQDKQRDANVLSIDKIIGNHGNVSQHSMQIWSDDGTRRIGARSAATVFDSEEKLKGYTDLVVDISALPRTLYFPLVATLLSVIDNWQGESTAPNLHVVVTEDPTLDRTILSEGLDDSASYIRGLGGAIDLEATADYPRVWFPMLGEDRAAYLNAIHALVNPDEIVPVLPFPSVTPRRSDDLIVEYQDLLLDRLLLEPGSFLYVPEANPFGAYRAIMTTAAQYRDALTPLGEAKTILSALSSKLLSLGALLAAYELKRQGHLVGVAHVNVSGYRLEVAAPGPQNEEGLFSAWLAGECYDSPTG